MLRGMERRRGLVVEDMAEGHGGGRGCEGRGEGEEGKGGWVREMHHR